MKRGGFDGVRSVEEMNQGELHHVARGRSDWFDGGGSKNLVVLLDPEDLGTAFRLASVLESELERKFVGRSTLGAKTCMHSSSGPRFSSLLLHD